MCPWIGKGFTKRVNNILRLHYFLCPWIGFCPEGNQQCSVSKSSELPFPSFNWCWITIMTKYTIFSQVWPPLLNQVRPLHPTQYLSVSTKVCSTLRGRGGMTDAHTSVNASMPVLENTNALRGTCTDISYQWDFFIFIMWNSILWRTCICHFWFENWGSLKNC